MKSAPGTGRRNLEGARAAARIFLGSARLVSSPDRGRAAWRHDAWYQAARTQFDTEAAEPVIAGAKRGDLIARESLHQVIAWFIHEREPIPEPLRHYLLNLLLQDDGPKKKKRGRGAHDYYLRDSLIASAVKAVKGYGFAEHRNSATDAPSACSIVSEVLAEAGIHMNEKNVERICDCTRP